MANSDMCLEAAQKVYPNNEDLRVAYMLGFNNGFDKAKEQPEVDIEREIEWEWVHREKQEVDLIECAEMDKEAFIRFARHFYELGLKARKK